MAQSGSGNLQTGDEKVPPVPDPPALYDVTLPPQMSETMGARQRTMTTIGREYLTEVKANRLNSLFSQLRRRFNSLELMVSEDRDIAELTREHHSWLSAYEEYLQLHKDFSHLHSGQDDPFEDKTGLLQMYKRTLEQRFLHDVEKKEPVVKPQDSVSQISRGSRGASLVTSLSSARIREEQRRAELSAKLSAISLKRDIELAKVNLKLKEEELALQTEMGVANARAQVLDKLEKDSYVRSQHGSIKNVLLVDNVKQETHPANNETLYKKNVTDANVQPLRLSAMPFVPAEYANVCNAPCFPQEPTNQFLSAPSVPHSSDPTVGSVIRQLRKPVPDIKCFGGDPLEYKRFIRQFKSKIITNTDDYDELLNYLEQFTTGDANKVVCGYAYLDSLTGYNLALRELERRYGSQEVLANAFVKRALDWPVIKADAPKSLDDFAIFLDECNNAVQTIEAVKVLQYPDNLKRLVSKLPFHFQDKWRSTVLAIKLRNETVCFQHLCDFVKMEAIKACDPTYGRDALRTDQRTASGTLRGGKSSTYNRSSKASFATTAVDTRSDVLADQSSDKVAPRTAPQPQKYCIFCEKSSHTVDRCHSLARKPYVDRITFLKTKGVCFGCVRPGHLNRDCRNRSVCSTCNGRHPTSLHDDSKTTQRQGTDKPQVDNSTDSVTGIGNNICSYTGAGDGVCCMAIVPVSVRSKDGLQSITTYAFLDPGSNVSFITDQLLHKIGGSGKRMCITIDTMGVAHKLETRAVSGIQIGDLSLTTTINVNRVYTKDRIPVSKQHIPTSKDIAAWPHLRDVELPGVDADIGLLIGSNVPDAYTPLQVRTGPRGSPHATKSLLGWIVWNVLRDQTDQRGYSVNRAEITAIREEEQFRRLDQLVRDSINLEFPERLIDDKRECSQEDKRFIQSVQNSVQLIDGHYVIRLPFKKENIVMPNNKSQAFRRLANLKNKLATNPSLLTDYQNFMQQILDKGYAENVPPDETHGSNGRVWYIPHHGVYHPKKPQKIRVVFDCAATYQGVSLNSVLLQGPDMTNSLLGVLLRFRQEPVAVMGDIETMFYQVRVPSQDRDFLRFLWWPAGDIHQEPQVYRMTVHLFGAVSSPSCSSFALKQTAVDNEHHFDSKIATGINRNFYVDDYLTSTLTEEEAVQCIKDTSSMCLQGGFKLAKWVSNNHVVLESVPLEDRSKEVKLLDLKKDRLPSDRALGIFWIVESDRMSFRIEERSMPWTRRGILSLASSVYDPLGFLAPYTFIAKRILQDLCRQGVGWDDDIPDTTRNAWSKWMEGLPLLENLVLPRCYKPMKFGAVTSCELHHFADASDHGYGMVSYVRTTDDTGRIHVSLVLGKARVSPLKKITIPRMELTAATAIVRFNKMLTEELDYEITRTCFWTDSMSVLRYIANETSRFQTFVANRVAVIRDATEVCQWRYVGTQSNPADCASRGLSMEKLLYHKQWFNGPEFLWYPEERWPQQADTQGVSLEEDPEIKKVVNTASCTDEHPIERLISYFSDWFRLRKAVGWLLRARRNLLKYGSTRMQQEKTLADSHPPVQKKRQVLKSEIMKSQVAKLEKIKDIRETYLSVQDLAESETELIRYVQRKHFPEEIILLQKNLQIKRSSALFKLDPFLKDGIIRVGGRIERSALPVTIKHPIVLPKDSRVSKLVLEDTHHTVGHLGKNAILAHVRRTYWIIGASSLIKSILASCTTCKRYQSPSQVQKMSSLPSECLTADEPPFFRVGMDYFGPFEVKRGRVYVKRYGVIFTCLATRAVHLEVAASLDADSCVNAVRRFVARRGPVNYIRSDNGTNLVATERELREEISKLDIHKMQGSLLKNSITWEFNPPSASHFGGVWERLIRLVRKVLHSLLHTQVIRLDDEGLATLLCEVEGILNGRPITESPNSPNDLDVLTPNHLLLMRPGEEMPPGLFNKEDIYCKRRWRQIQYLADLFWKRWVKEYIPLLQQRQKWNSARRNVAVGDIVLVMDSSPRNAWALGRIVEVYKDKSGLVRSVKLKTKSTTLLRPIAKLCLVLEADLTE